MSDRPSPDPGIPFDFPVQTTPEWLSHPARLAKEREPWYYGFLEKYARVLLWSGVLMFLLSSSSVLVFFLAPEAASRAAWTAIASLGSQARGVPGHVREVDPVAIYSARIATALILIGISFFVFLLPILLSVAYILLSVDAGRNLRAVRRDRASGP